MRLGTEGGQCCQKKAMLYLRLTPRGYRSVTWRTSDQRGFSGAFVSVGYDLAEHSSLGSHGVSFWPYTKTKLRSYVNRGLGGM